MHECPAVQLGLAIKNVFAIPDREMTQVDWILLVLRGNVFPLISSLESNLILLFLLWELMIISGSLTPFGLRKGKKLLPRIM